MIELGAASRRAGRRAEARDLLRPGMELAHACGARALVARAREVAQALFVTMRTVEVHLTHAYQKLGISSREELPAALG